MEGPAKGEEAGGEVYRRENGRVRINAQELHFRELNAMVERAAAEGASEVKIDNVSGQRYIGSGVRRPVHIDVFGVPGDDLGAFMDGPEIVVHRSARDGVGHTMHGGDIVVHGRAGDVVGMGMRGGSIYIKGSVGRRAAIHMKERERRRPVLVIGGSCRDFLGEYMAGGVVVVLGLEAAGEEDRPPRHLGAGMHGGVIYIRGGVEPEQVDSGVSPGELCAEDRTTLQECVDCYVENFGGDAGKILDTGFTKLQPATP